MSGVNKAIIVGRLGKDPEIRSFESGSKVASFSVATSETYKPKGSDEKKEFIEWHQVLCWNSLAGIAEKYLKKGDMVYIEGKIRTRSWEKDGITRYTTEIVTEEMNMISTKPRSNRPPMPQEEAEVSVTKEVLETASVEDGDDLPF
jgi:single-strand DNA-binding protein